MVVQQKPTMEPLRRWDPEQIGPYGLLGRLGAGAMGQVFLGRSTAGRLVAVKTIKIEFAEEAGFRARFAQEVAAARRVSGVFTAAVIAADPEADMPWLATAYVPAPSLTQLVRRCGPLPVPATRWLAAGCAEALESIHTAGLVHRDLKPSNVLVAPDGPRVIDFGVARAAERIQLTVTHGAVGTPAYMAPEQARDTRQASMASDMFSLGATLLFAATGHAPYQGETVMDVLVRLATEPPDLTGLPEELTDMVNACLERSPRKRPASATLLTQLGPFVDAPAAAHGSHAYLTPAAIGLIEDYRHGPQLTDGTVDDETSGDATVGSHTALPVPRGRRIRRRPRWARWSPALPPEQAAAPPQGHARPGRGDPRSGGPCSRRGHHRGPAEQLRRWFTGSVQHADAAPVRRAAPATAGRATADRFRSLATGPARDRIATALWRSEHGVPGARHRLDPTDPGHGGAGRPRGGPFPACGR
jgi:hypothetical protein